MKLKMTLAALIASVALAVLLSPGTASATVFCEENKAPCPEGKLWKENTEMHLTASEIFTFKLPNGTAFEGCQSTLLTTIKKPGSATSTVLTETSKLTWPGCTQAEQDTLAAGELEFHAIEGTTNATVTVKNLKIHVTSFFDCVVSSGSSAHFGTLTSSGTGDAVLHVNTVLVTEEFCSVPEIRLTGAYTQASPVSTPLYVKAG